MSCNFVLTLKELRAGRALATPLSVLENDRPNCRSATKPEIALLRPFLVPLDSKEK
jgi:hypothetical protein